MRRILFILLAICTAGSVFAGDRDHMRKDPLGEAVAEILADEKDTVISDLTFGEVEDLVARLSVPMQEAAYVDHARMASYMMPGTGQFMTGDKLGGALFLTADLLVAAGTLTAVYFLLPPELPRQIEWFPGSAAERLCSAKHDAT